MLAPELLEYLRCPLDPTRSTRFTDEELRLRCPVCGIIFPIKDGFPSLVVEEATLPDGIDSPEQLARRHGERQPRGTA